MHLSLARARRLVGHTPSFGRPLIERPLAVREAYLGRALDRSLAHEIGHYLLSERDHRDRGLMRRTLTADDISTAALHRFRLSADDARRVHTRIDEARQLCVQALGDAAPVMRPIHGGR